MNGAKRERRECHSRQLIDSVIELIERNDHDSLAFIARRCGVPPQLRHVVWPILLKYHPLCISPNTISNTVVWDAKHGCYQSVERKHWRAKDLRQAELREEYDLDSLILYDLHKYFKVRTTITKHEGPDKISDSDLTEVESRIIDTLKDSIKSFEAKWSPIYQYESSLAWIALGLAEWCPPLHERSSSDGTETSMVLSGKRSGRKHGHFPIISSLYDKYPLPVPLRNKLPKNLVFTFDQLLERLLLVILHSPDVGLAQRQISEKLTSTSWDSSQSTNYYPVISGGDVGFRIQTFFKVFSSMLPELYQTLTDENSIYASNARSSWLYWWIDCCGARAFQKQDRARLWDLLLGWRPEPNMNSINFFLNYNNKKFDHLYGTTTTLQTSFMKSLCKNDDPFWFPHLDEILSGQNMFISDFEVLHELLKRNSNATEKSPTLESFSRLKKDRSKLAGSESSSNLSLSDVNNRPRLSDGSRSDSSDSIFESPRALDDYQIPFSLMDLHLQIVFIYVAILQYNEFRLLEYEETEIAEFLSNVPLLSKADDISYRELYDVHSWENSNAAHEESIKRPPTGSSSHMMIEMGNDGKSSQSFNDLLLIAGNIWRKWLRRELQENLGTN